MLLRHILVSGDQRGLRLKTAMLGYQGLLAMLQ